MTSAALVSLANHLWQSTLFAAAVWLVTLLLRANAASVRHRLWLTASVKFLVPFSLLVGLGARLPFRAAPVAPPRPVAVAVAAIGTPFPAIEGTVGTVQRRPERPSSLLLNALAVLWFCGFAGCVGWWFWGWRRLRQARRRGVPLEWGGGAIAIPVISSKDRIEPGVFGIFRPALLLPEGIDHQLTPEQLNAVVAHEISHVKRRDNLANALHMLAEALFWFYPPVWWIERRLLHEQERACDEEVLRQGGDPQVYAESILRICEFYITSPLICVPGITGSDLKLRVREIMRAGVRPRLSVAGRFLLYMAAVLAVAGPMVVGVVVRAQTPVAAQAPTFDVATLKLSPPPKEDRIFINLGKWRTGRFTMENVTLSDMMKFAYQVVADAQLVVPDWNRKVRFDVQGKAPADTKMPELRLMLRALLGERLNLKVRSEQRVLPYLALVRGKSAPKIQRVEEISNPSVGMQVRGHISHPQMSMQGLVTLLSRFERQTIVDQTGLDGVYQVNLEWTPDNVSAQLDPNAPPADRPSLFTAVSEQLGLKLESRHGPVDVLVVQSASRVPEEN